MKKNKTGKYFDPSVNLDKAIKDKLAKDGVSKEWMDKHLINDIGGDE